MIVLKNILVPVDFSDASHTAPKYARDLASNYDGRVHLLHVTPDVLVSYSSDFVPMATPEVQHDAEAAARAELETLARELGISGARIEVRTSGSPAAEIVAYAETEPIDLIVVGTRGRGGMAHFLLGSTAERVVRTAPCPVLTVRHPDPEVAIPVSLETEEAIPAASPASELLAEPL